MRSFSSEFSSRHYGEPSPTAGFDDEQSWSIDPRSPDNDRSFSSLLHDFTIPAVTVPLGQGVLVAAGGLLTGAVIAVVLSVGTDDIDLATTDGPGPSSTSTAHRLQSETLGTNLLQPFVGDLNVDLPTSSLDEPTAGNDTSTSQPNPAQPTTTAGSSGAESDSATQPSDKATTPTLGAAPPTLRATSQASTTTTSSNVTEGEAPSVPSASSTTTTTTTVPAPTSATTAATSSSTSASSSSSTSAPTSTSVAPTTTQPPAPAQTGIWDYYGNPWVPSHLANLSLQGNDRYSYRFVAKHSGLMNGFQNYMQANTSRTGYAGGDGGTIRYRLVPDNGSGLPDESQVLAETIWHPGLNNGSALPPGSSNYTDSHPISFADKYWTTKPTLTAGTTYHLLIENIDSDSNNNYISINNPYAISSRPRSPLGPQVEHWGVTRNLGSGWHDYSYRNNGTSRYEVNLMILMDNGNHYGNSYMDSKDAYPVNGSNQLRQIFTPTTDHTIDQLAVFTSGTGTLRTTLKENGTTIATWTTNTTGENHNIINTGTHTLKTGTTYQLEFSADTGNLSMLTFREGSLGTGYLYPKGGSWDDGHAQNNTGNGWNDTFYTYADVAGITFHTTN